MAGLPFGFTGFLLDSSSGDLFFDADLCSLVPLGFDQLSVAQLLILARLEVNNGELVLLKDFHLSLLKSLFDEHIEHGLNLRIKVKKFIVSIVDLR